jgi:hypothetical protein
MSPEEFEAFTEVTPDMFKNFEECGNIVASCEEVAKKLVRTIPRERKNIS